LTCGYPDRATSPRACTAVVIGPRGLPCPLSISGCGRGFDGGRTDGIGLKLIHPHRTAALHAPDRIAWIERTLDAA
jgi:hypothetical protein